MIAWRNKIDAESMTLIIALSDISRIQTSFPNRSINWFEKGYIKTNFLLTFSAINRLPYRKTDNSFLLYSWGDNLKDDGGEIARDKKGKSIRFADTGDGYSGLSKRLIQNFSILLAVCYACPEQA